MSKDAKATGGKQTKSELKSAKDWCEYYGVKTQKGLARVYKGLHGGFSSKKDPSFKYLPGTKPKAPSFNQIECSDGLHFSPCPEMTHEFISDPKHYAECWVDISGMLVFFEGEYPQKCKAAQVEREIIEVDIKGNHILKKDAV